ncbi:MAG: PKD domain-containing protein, partial [Lewinella sp.]|nr:PKD domain-containing protein [Lewinella sp.]
NGLPLGPPQAPSPASTSITTFQPACYTVAVTDGCYTRLSNRVCPEMCDPVAAIHCPIDNPCACLEQPIMLDGGLLSYSNCGSITSYDWTIIDGAGTHTFNGQILTYQFLQPITTVTFILTITDSSGCTETSKALMIRPCE